MPAKQKDSKKSKAFKNWIDGKLLHRIASSIVAVYPEFNADDFLILEKKLSKLELKARVHLVRDQLYRSLPPDYKKSVKILLASTAGGKLKGFDLWPYTEYVQVYGLGHLELSLDALYELTKLFTAEFAVRPFLKRYPKETLAFLEKCSVDPSVHVRRWASEGSRPRLPWGERLDSFIVAPESTISILQNLRNDPELYVRKSVANHLNDIAKDNPKTVLALLAKWRKEAAASDAKNIDWITKHSLRTLIKEGNPAALKLIGVSQGLRVNVENFLLKKKTIKMGESLEFCFELHSLEKSKRKIVVDYIVFFQRANGKITPKVFKLKTFIAEPRKVFSIRKKHSLRKITTRQYYPGTHYLSLQINGISYYKLAWRLLIE